MSYVASRRAILRNPMATPGFDKLKHIVVLMMENRSFDHMLGALKATDARIDGIDGTQSNPDTAGGTAPARRRRQLGPARRGANPQAQAGSDPRAGVDGR